MEKSFLLPLQKDDIYVANELFIRQGTAKRKRPTTQ
jgi:hypothetical protein